MNIKKIILAAGLILGGSHIQAVGELESVAIGAVCGPVHEYLIFHTPKWASVVGVPAMLVAQQLWFNAVRRSMVDEVRKLGSAWNAEYDQCRGEVISFASTVIMALAAYGIDGYLSKQKADKPNAHVSDANVGLGVI